MKVGATFDKTMAVLVGALIAMTFLSLAASHAQAVEIILDKLWLNSYLRGTGLTGPTGSEGQDPSAGSDFEDTLFDESYFETELVYDYDHKFRVHNQIALDNGNLFHLSADPDHVNLVIRDFYLEAFDAGGSGNTAWVGARKYRKLDEHNIYGLGYSAVLTPTLRAGLALGMRKDSAYWGAKDAGVAVTLTPNPATYRHYTILDVEKLLGSTGSVLLVLEHQFIGPTVATYTSGAESWKYDLETQQGFVAGVEYNRWGAGWNNTSQVIGEYGDAAGSAISKLNTRGYSAGILDQTGSKPLTVDYFRRHSKRAIVMNAGAWMGEKFSVSHLVGYTYDFLETVHDKSMLVVGARPFHNTTKTLRLGVDLNRTFAFEGYSKPGFTIVAPTARIALDQDNYGRPFLQFFVANTLYDRPYALYRDERKYALTIGAQFEATF